MASAVVIPGLVRGACIAWSGHDAPTPRLVRSDVAGLEVDFEWSASGTSVYTVTAKGSIVISSWNERGAPCFDTTKFLVSCSYPSGQELQQSGRRAALLYVCKHANAALVSVLDPAAGAGLEARRLAHVALVEAARKVQEEQMPGDRERIEHGMQQLGAEKVLEILGERMKTLEGLRDLVRIFPSDVMPPKKAVKCGWCEVEYDPQIASKLICNIEHPYEKTKTEWENSKKSNSYCRRCGKCFNYHGWGSDDEEDGGDYCFEGVHVPENEYDADKDSDMQFDEEED